MQIFKQKDVNIQPGMGFIYTPKSVGCGLNLKIGKKYIVCGECFYIHMKYLLISFSITNTNIKMLSLNQFKKSLFK